MTLTDLILKTNVGFGTSGIRALSVEITDEVTYLYTKAFLNYLKSAGYNFNKVVLAGDRRPSTPKILNAVANACLDEKLEIIYGGQIPTPALSYYGFMNKIPGIMVTGSHIPFDRNGIKFNKPNGELLKDDEQELKEQSIVEPFKSIKEIQLNVDPQVIEVYKQRYKNFFPNNFLKGRKIGLYGHSSVARELFDELLQYFGAEVTRLNFTDEFVPIDTDAFREEDRILCKQWSDNYKFDAIVSTDGDADRPMIADNLGNLQNGDLMGILVAQYLNATHVVAPINSNTAIELSNLFKVKRTKIGSPYVVKGMLEVAAESKTNKVVGFEINGGFLLGSNVTKEGRTLDTLITRDALTPILSLLALSIESNKDINQLFSELPKRFAYNDRLKEFPTEKSKEIISNLTSHVNKTMNLKDSALDLIADKIIKIDVTDGLRMTLENGDIIHLRPSGNAPELRCYTESSSIAISKELNKLVLDRILSLKI